MLLNHWAQGTLRKWCQYWSSRKVSSPVPVEVPWIFPTFSFPLGFQKYAFSPPLFLGWNLAPTHPLEKKSGWGHYDSLSWRWMEWNISKKASSKWCVYCEIHLPYAYCNADTTWSRWKLIRCEEIRYYPIYWIRSSTKQAFFSFKHS